MYILFIRFPLESRLHGGAEQQILRLMQGLQTRGHLVRFLGSCSALLQMTSLIGIPTQRLAVGNPPVTKWGALSFAWRKYQMQQKIQESIEEMDIQPDIIFMFSLTEKLLLTQWCLDRRKKVVWVEHDPVGRWLLWNPWLPTLRRLSTVVTTVTVSQLSRKLYLKMGWKPENLISIPNGIDAEKFQKVTQSDSANLRIGCIARLAREKGVDLLLQAISRLSNVQITIVGTGPEEENIRNIAHRLNAAEHGKVTVLPSVEKSTDLYEKIDLFVLPSRTNDPFGLVIAEAMAAGIPVICTDACGIASELEERDAVVVSAGNPEALTQAIEQFRDPARRRQYSERGTRVAQERFSVTTMVEKYAKIL